MEDAAAHDGRSQSPEDDGSLRKRRKKNMEYDSNDVSANCFVATPEFLRSFIDSTDSGKDGVLFGFANDMEGVASIPKALFSQMAGVLHVLHSPDDRCDILADSTVSVQFMSKTSSVVKSATMVGAKNEGQGRICELLQVSPAEYREIVGEMGNDSSEAGEGGVRRFFGGEGDKRSEPLRHAKLFITTHRVEYMGPDGVRGSKQAMVLWVYCSKHFDFVGKMARMYSNQDSWRKHKNSKEADKKRAEMLEKQYANWKEILLGLVCSSRVAKVWRGLEMRVGMDPFENLLNDLHPESFYSMTNPVAVYHAMCWMIPDRSTASRVEGMDYQRLQDCELTWLQYMRRFIAFRKQFLACQKAQAEAQKRRPVGKASSEAGEAGSEAGEACDAGEEEEEEGGPSGEEEMLAGNDAPFVRDVLYNRTVEHFDELGWAKHVQTLGWPTVHSTANNLVCGLPETGVVAYLDFGSMAGEVGGIVTEDAKWLQARFGELPMRLRWRINNGMMGGGGEEEEEDEGLTEAAFLPPSYTVEESQRRKMFSCSANPFMGYIYDKVYAHHTETFFREVVQRNGRIRLYLLYIRSMQNHLRSDLLAGKARSVVLQSTQTYVDSLEFEIARGAWEVMEEPRQRFTVDGGSDFEVYQSTYHSILHMCNTGYWGLTGRNMFLLVNLNASEILWRCGTFGNFKWIGMPINVLDGAGLLLSKNGTNLKKAGTCGFDYTRITRDTMKCLYQVVVPRAVLEQFPNGDGHISASTMRMTPNSVGEGLIQIVEDKVVDEPNENKMGTMMILPEGLGDRESLENCVKFTPRDSNVDVQMESTVDMNKTGQRQKLIKKGVAGMTLCLCAFARNQQPDQAEMVRRTEDLGRVCTLICSSGGEELSRTDVFVENGYDKKLGWNTASRGNGRAAALIGKSGGMSSADKKKYAMYFSLVPMVTSLVCLQQKTGIVLWNVAPDVAFVLREVQTWIAGFGSVLLSGLKIAHSSRFFDSAISMAGVAQTVLIRTYAEMADGAKCGRSIHESIVRVSQLQSVDALHFSLVPAVFMRFLVGMIDYPVMWVLSAMFREVKMPVIDLVSAIQLLSGVEVTNARDGATVKRYVVQSLRDGALCAAHEYGDVSESTNVMMYVTAKPGVATRTAMRMKFNPQEAQNKDWKKFVNEKLQRNACEVLEEDAKQYGQFCADHHELSVIAAMTKMCANDFDLSGLLGGGAVFNDHRKWVANVMGEGPGPRWAGIPEMHRGEFNLLRVLPVGDASVGYGINIPTALVLSALMQQHSKDWGIQMQVAESVVKHVVEKCVPYSLLPLKGATMDNYVTDQGILETSFDGKYRPLSMGRISCNTSVFQQKPSNAVDTQAGTTEYGVLEDTAHMQPLLSMASMLHYERYWDLDLQKWNFEVKWGGEGDVTPLRFYPNNTALEGGADGRFAATAERVAYVVVLENNILELVVIDPVGGGEERVECGGLHCDRTVQQKVVFGHQWGPAFKFGRTGILFRGATAEAPLRTLVPVEARAPDDMVKNGFEGLEYFRDGFYLASTGDPGDSVRLSVSEAEERIVRTGAPLGVSHDAPAMAAYSARASQINYRDSRRAEGQPYPGVQYAKLVIDDSRIPIHGLVPVVMQMMHSNKKSGMRMLRVDVEPKFIQLFADEDAAKWCHRHINADRSRGAAQA